MVLQCAMVNAMLLTSVGDIAWVRIVDCKPPRQGYRTGRAFLALTKHVFFLAAQLASKKGIA